MRYLGIDYGSKRIGTAISSEDGRFALPMDVLPNSGELVDQISKIADKNKVTQIILGESRNYKGEANKILKDSKEFKKELELRGFKVIFEPEFMTSMQAERLQGKNDKTDASAAAIILQTYLDRIKNK